MRRAKPDCRHWPMTPGCACPALGGRPGVLSARYAGEPKSDIANNAKLIADLHGAGDRSAHFYCVIVLVRSADDPQPLIADGEWHGEIIEDARGAGGFGYDPHFFVPSLEQTAAELDAELKNTLSHRASAMRHLLSRLQGLQGLLTG
jgi:XTP/dITP diphosphohydrolase